MVVSRRPSNETGGVILNSLEFRYKIVRRTGKEGVAVIDARENESTYQCLQSVVCEILTNRANSTKFKVASLTGTGDVLLKGESLIKCETKVADRC